MRTTLHAPAPPRVIALVSALFLSAAAPTLADPPPGGTTAPTVTATAGAPAPKARFLGFGLDFAFWDDNSLNAASYYNGLSFLFLPKWDLGDKWLRGSRFERLSLGARFVVTKELRGYDETGYSATSDQGRITPCSALTPSQNGGVINPYLVQRCDFGGHPDRTDYSDVLLSLTNPKLVTIPKLELNFNPAISLIIPASAQSRLATLRAAIGFGLGVNRVFFDGKLAFGYSAGFTKYFHKYTVAEVSAGESAIGVGTFSPNLPNVDLTQISFDTADFYSDPTRQGGILAFNPTYGTRQIFSMNIAPTEKLNISVLYLMLDSWAYPIDGQCVIQVNGQPQDVCATGQTVAQGSGSEIVTSGSAHKRPQQIFWFTVGYQLTDWLNVNLAWFTQSTRTHDDGTPRQPFVSTNYDAFTKVSAGATITLEKLAAKAF